MSDEARAFNMAHTYVSIPYEPIAPTQPTPCKCDNCGAITPPVTDLPLEWMVDAEGALLCPACTEEPIEEEEQG